MPLESREDYERLNEHLAEIDAPLAAFALRNGYQITPRLIAGLYPRVNLRRERLVTSFIEISMDFDNREQRFDHFFPEIPYTFFGTAWVDDTAVLTRWRSPDIRLERVPFRVLVQTLQLQLDHFHSYLSSLTEEYIRACGRTVSISPPPPDCNLH